MSCRRKKDKQSNSNPQGCLSFHKIQISIATLQSVKAALLPSKPGSDLVNHFF